MSVVLIVAARQKAHQEASAVERALAKLSGHKVHFVDASMRVRKSLPAKQAAASVVSVGMRDRVKRAIAGLPFARAVMLWRGAVLDRVRSRHIFDTLKPDVIVLFDDRNVRPDLVIATEAAARGIAVVIVPFAISSAEADALLRRDKAEHRIDMAPRRWLKKAIANRWPGQVGGVDRNLLFFNAWDTVALRAAGVLSPRPWVQGGSGVDLICASGPDEQVYLTDGGIDPARIALTGQPSLDELNLDPSARHSRRSNLMGKYSLTGDAPLIVCAVPQDAEHRLVDWDRHRTLTERLFATLAQSGAAVLLSLHPRSNCDDYQEAASRHGLRIADEPLANLLPAADLLVGTYSSTLRWAIGLGIPAIVVDALGLDWDLYRDLEGVRRLGDHAALASELAIFVNSAEARAEFAISAARGALRTGRVDGQASARLTDAVDRIIGMPRGGEVARKCASEARAPSRKVAP